MSADPDGVTRLIPHRPPILCIDRVVEVSAAHAVSERVVSDGPDVDGGELWEVGLLEGLAQTAALVHGDHARREGAALGTPMLAEVRGLTIARRARRGERIRFRADLVKHLAPVVLFRAEASCDGEPIARGDMKFFVGEAVA